MTKYLLDTNVVSELRRADRCDVRVAQWQSGTEPQSCFLSAISLMELRLGIELALRRDRKAGEALQSWYQNKVRPGFAGRILAVGDAVAESCAQLHAERPRSFRDSLILATALVHRLVLVTRNVHDFDHGEVPVINPWKG